MHVAVILDESKFFSGEPPLSYGAEKRRDHRNLLYAHAISVIPSLLSTITKGGGGGGGSSPEFFSRLVSITAKCFSYPQTNLGERLSRRLGVMSATN